MCERVVPVPLDLDDARGTIRQEAANFQAGDEILKLSQSTPLWHGAGAAGEFGDTQRPSGGYSANTAIAAAWISAVTRCP